MLMTRAYVVVLLQIVSGKLRQATFVGPHLTGPAVVFAGLMKGSSRFTSVVGKKRMICGKPLSEKPKGTSSLDWRGMDTREYSSGIIIFYFAHVNEILRAI